MSWWTFFGPEKNYLPPPPRDTLPSPVCTTPPPLLGNPPLHMGETGTIWQFFRALFPSTWRTLSPKCFVYQDSGHTQTPRICHMFVLSLLASGGTLPRNAYFSRQTLNCQIVRFQIRVPPSFRLGLLLPFPATETEEKIKKYIRNVLQAKTFSPLNFGTAPLQKCVGDFCCINFGGFCRGFSWKIFLGTFSHKNEEKKIRRQNPKKKKIRRLENKNPRKIRSAKIRP